MKYLPITKGLSYRKTNKGNIVLKRKSFTKLTLKNDEIIPLMQVLGYLMDVKCTYQKPNLKNLKLFGYELIPLKEALRQLNDYE